MSLAIEPSAEGVYIHNGRPLTPLPNYIDFEFYNILEMKRAWTKERRRKNYIVLPPLKDRVLTCQSTAQSFNILHKTWILCNQLLYFFDGMHHCCMVTTTKFTTNFWQ